MTIKFRTFYLIIILCLPLVLYAEISTEVINSSSQTIVSDSQYDSQNHLFGTVLKKQDTLTLVYTSFSSSGAVSETISNSINGLAKPYLVYDKQGNPQVLIASNNKEIIHFYKQNGQWTQQTVFTLDQQNYPNLSVNISAVKIDSNDALHIICVNDYSLFYLSNHSGSWNSAPDVVEELAEDHVNVEFGFRISIRGLPSIAIDSLGKAHVVYSTTYETRYLTNLSATWIGEDIFRDTNMDYWPAENPVIILDNNQAPAIVATEMDHAITGSLINSNLRYLVRNGEAIWNSSTISEKADNYTGSDGNKFTGVNTTLLFDAQNQPHILFSDIASSHNEQSWNYTKNGQIRYAFLKNEQWQLETLYPQSPSNSEMISVELEKIDDNSELHYVALEVLRVGNVYDLYDSETYNLKYFYPESAFINSEQSLSLQITSNISQNTISIEDNFSFSLQLQPGNLKGTAADWWLARLSPNNQLSYYHLNGTWSSEEKAAYQGVLTELSSVTFNDSQFSDGAGKYTYYFAIDTNMNNTVDFSGNNFFYDQVEISIE